MVNVDINKGGWFDLGSVISAKKEVVWNTLIIIIKTQKGEIVIRQSEFNKINSMTK